MVTVRRGSSGKGESHIDKDKRNLDIPLLVTVRQTESTNKRNLDKPPLVTVRRDSTEGDATQTVKPLTEEETIESDSDATVPEPSSPQLCRGMPSLTQSRDLPLCKVLNISREDRRSLCSHALLLLCSFIGSSLFSLASFRPSLRCICCYRCFVSAFVLSSFAFVHYRHHRCDRYIYLRYGLTQEFGTTSILSSSTLVSWFLLHSFTSLPHAG